MIVLPLLALVFGIHPAPTTDPEIDGLPTVTVTPPPAPTEEDFVEAAETPSPAPPDPTPTPEPLVAAATPEPTPEVTPIAIVETPTPTPEVTPVAPIPPPAPVAPGASASGPEVRADNHGASKRSVRVHRRPTRDHGRRHGNGPGSAARRHRREQGQAGTRPRKVASGPTVQPVQLLTRTGGQGGGAGGRPSDRIRYEVVRGDCLSLIATRYGRNWHIVARDNRLDDPDLIYPGQVLDL